MSGSIQLVSAVSWCAAKTIVIIRLNYVIGVLQARADRDIRKRRFIKDSEESESP